MMHLEGPYEITNELHRGKGYCDILLKSNKADLPHILIELKRRKEGDPNTAVLAESDLSQIHDKICTHMLTGRAILYGVAFDEAETSVCSEALLLRPAESMERSCASRGPPPMFPEIPIYRDTVGLSKPR